MNLIIIDDEPIQHFIMRKMIDVYVSSAPVTQYSSDGAAVLDFLYRNKNNGDELPDIIFLDLHMPMMNGWEFLDRFKRLRGKLNKQVNVYVISSSIDPEDISRSKKYNFVLDYIIKPMTKLKLKDIFGAN
ncbi:response regulator [Mucilaginibacter sp. SP1R1]|uniref:response regulator n=1 Tax=Mucilaginibacter sp. SP1R1 TaxID=2723091 RepID=UPI0016153987|nr:two-component SAPR family response regulator [Mucilaginibacter sp. SP1R1]